MTSHGVPRGEAVVKSERALQKEREDIAKYRSLVDQINTAVGNNEQSRHTLDCITKLLTRNPEDYTTWNHRRGCLLALLKDPAEDTESLLSTDLAFLVPLLMKFPKCYWIWNHRIWLLKETSGRCSADVSRQTWEREVGLVGKMLARDSRNFHGWSYRRLIIGELRKLNDVKQTSAPESSNTTVEAEALRSVQPTLSLTGQEFEYTTKMLRSNLSNFSAWHNRSKLIPRLLDERSATTVDRRKLFDAELSKVNGALSIDPYDQSLWFYHQYLTMEIVSRTDTSFGVFTDTERRQHLSKEIGILKELLEDFDDCKWILQNLVEHAVMFQTFSPDSSIPQGDVQSWLEKLKKLDPLRKGRWNDLERSMIN